ncbi:hypothetical protein Ocin01_19468 [Orchesella cincta]|uniref:Uncharacterized protein n=1 Tax=Orchesella cincta TaxID=48709 RepID=A0A1D2M2L6_ORCCI|nr:hypothetical protein Ocin01_19468 [Orchesella cincta]
MLARVREKLLSSMIAKQLSSYRYTQGQHNEQNPKIREYFYYIDHNGMLFLDDARMKNFTSCFKEVEFLQFFFKNIRATESSELKSEFPFVSYCGRERNYINVNASPFVFNSLNANVLEYNYTKKKLQFNPASLYVGSDGRLYHEFSHRDVNFALVKSSVADHLALQFVYKRGKPVAFKYEGKEIKLNYGVRRSVEEALLRSVEQHV